MAVRAYVETSIPSFYFAGVMEEGRVYRRDAGTPQGGVISPLLANICVHEVLDEWFAREVKPLASMKLDPCLRDNDQNSEPMEIS